MNEGEWLLEYPGVEFALGGIDSNGSLTEVFFTKAVDVGEPGSTREKQNRAGRDGSSFGRDFIHGRTITFELGLNMQHLPISEREAAVRDLEATLRKAWRASSIKETANGVASLTTLNAGRERAVYGRPERYVADDAYASQGYIGVTCDFATSDDLFYGTEQTIRADLVAEDNGGGFIVPFTTPLTVLPGVEQSEGILVHGDMPSWIRAKFTGPISNPTITVLGAWSQQLLLTLPAGQEMTIDPRPWINAVLRYDGASFTGALSRTSYLDLMFLEPGLHIVTLTGGDVTGTAFVDLTWQATYASLGTG